MKRTIPPFRAVFFGIFFPGTQSVGMNRLMGQELPPVLKKLDTALPGSDGFAVGEKVRNSDVKAGKFPNLKAKIQNVLLFEAFLVVSTLVRLDFSFSFF